MGGSEASVSRWRCRVLCRHNDARLCGRVSAHSGCALLGARVRPWEAVLGPRELPVPLLGRESSISRGRLLLPVLLPALQHRRGRCVHVQHEALPAGHLAVPQKVPCPTVDAGCVPGVIAMGPGGWKGFGRGWQCGWDSSCPCCQACPCCANRSPARGSESASSALSGRQCLCLVPGHQPL